MSYAVSEKRGKIHVLQFRACFIQGAFVVRVAVIAHLASVMTS